MNLVEFGFQKSNLFEHMPRFEEIVYVGNRDEKVRQYVASREGQACTLLALNFIRDDEKVLWEAVEDFVKRSTASAVASVRGVYDFDLVTINIHKEIKTFQHSELTSVIVNSARALAPGEMTMIKYSSVYALIHKKIDEDWGKITFKTTVDVFRDKPEFLDILIKRLLKDFLFSHDPVILLLNDLSQNPVFDPRNQTQQARLSKVIANLIPTSVEFVPEVYIQDRLGARELLSGSRL